MVHTMKLRSRPPSTTRRIFAQKSSKTGLHIIKLLIIKELIQSITQTNQFCRTFWQLKVCIPLFCRMNCDDCWWFATGKTVSHFEKQMKLRSESCISLLNYQLQAEIYIGEMIIIIADSHFFKPVSDAFILEVDI